MKQYQEINSEVIDSWCKEGWQWGEPISHEAFVLAQNGKWDVKLTPVKYVPHDWFIELKGKKVLGLASGGGQQMAIFSALGAVCTVLDYSVEQCNSEKLVAEREGYDIEIVQADMTKPLPFADESFDLIFHPVANCYIEDPFPVFKECYRVLKHGGRFLGGYDIGINYVLDEKQERIVSPLPFNPLQNKEQYEWSMKMNEGIQFSHTIEEQIRGQLKAGFVLKDLYEDTNDTGRLKEFGIPAFVTTLCTKE